MSATNDAFLKDAENAILEVLLLSTAVAHGAPQPLTDRIMEKIRPLLLEARKTDFDRALEHFQRNNLRLKDTP